MRNLEREIGRVMPQSCGSSWPRAGCNGKVGVVADAENLATYLGDQRDFREQDIISRVAP